MIVLDLSGLDCIFSPRDVVRVDVNKNNALITSLESAKEFFREFDPSVMNRIFVLDLDNVRVSRVTNLEDVYRFYKEDK